MQSITFHIILVAHKRIIQLKQKTMKQLTKQLTLLFFFVFSAICTLAQEQVTGTVTDNNGEPLPGVTVRVKDTNRGSITDAE